MPLIELHVNNLRRNKFIRKYENKQIFFEPKYLVQCVRKSRDICQCQCISSRFSCPCVLTEANFTSNCQSLLFLVEKISLRHRIPGSGRPHSNKHAQFPKKTKLKLGKICDIF